MEYVSTGKLSKQIILKILLRMEHILYRRTILIMDIGFYK